MDSLYFPAFPSDASFLPLLIGTEFSSALFSEHVHKRPKRPMLQREIINEALRGHFFRIKSCILKGQGQGKGLFGASEIMPALPNDSYIFLNWLGCQLPEPISSSLLVFHLHQFHQYLCIGHCESMFTCLLCLRSVFTGDCGGAVLNHEV